MKIAIIGSGNVAAVLGNKIKEAGHSIPQLYFNSNLPQAKVLAAMFNAEAINNFNQLDLHADLYLVAISDSALPAMVKALPPLNGIVVHTAGAVSIDILKNVSGSYGVLYPLQSLRKEKKDYEEIPLLIDGNTADTAAAIKAFADTISGQVRQANDDYRLRLHTAAVVVSNFTNHLYSLAADYCREENIDFALLQPLITETAERLQYYAPAQMQTGPAIRHDTVTIARHLELLQAYPHLKKLYEVLTESIQEKMNN